MSENLTQLIQRIDFNQPIDELRKEFQESEALGRSDDDNKQAKSKETSTLANPTWPFESMLTRLKTALTEVCVMCDVLVIAREKKYMVFDAVNPKVPDTRPYVLMLTKKKSLSVSATQFFEGADRLRSCAGIPLKHTTLTSSGESSSQGSASQSIVPSNELSFYQELKEIRQNWRLKRQGNVIFGDLSDFRPIGHRFVGSSRFKVIKVNQTTAGPNSRALDVEISPDLEGRAYIQVSIIKDNEISLCDLTTSAKGRCYEPLKQRTWQEKLEAAQNVMFCYDLFSHLAKQAVQYQFFIPTTVAGNQIILALFPDVKLYLTLVHLTPNAKTPREETDGMRKLRNQHKAVFEHSLHQMFRDFYSNMLRKMQGLDIPPEAGPCAMDKQTLFELTRQESFLDKIVQQAQHLIMRQQTMEVIDNFATKIRDPLIISHWFCLNSPTSSIVRVDIVSHNNEILGRSHMLIYIGTRQRRVITRDCKNLLLGYEPDELRHLLVWQSCLHQFIASDKLSKLLGWYTLSLNYNVNVTRQDLSSTAFSLVICSSNCSHLISIKSGPQFGLAVNVAQFKEPPLASSMINNTLSSNGFSSNGGSVTGLRLSNGCSSVKTDRDAFENSLEFILTHTLPSGPESDGRLSRFQDLVDNFREVDWDLMQGKDFLTRLELLMAAFTDVN